MVIVYYNNILNNKEVLFIQINYPYSVEINTKEEAVHYIKNQCNNCPNRRGNWDCSGAQVSKCQKVIDNVVEEFSH